MGREREGNMALILAICGLFNGSNAATAYLAVAVVTAQDLGPATKRPSGRAHRALASTKAKRPGGASDPRQAASANGLAPSRITRIAHPHRRSASNGQHLFPAGASQFF